jgi:heme A synthase
MQLEDASTIEFALFLSDYVTVALGLVIAYIAFRGYRDHRSRPMLFVAVGLVLFLGVPGLLGLLFVALPVGEIAVGIVTQASEILGMCLILYGLWMDPS